MAMTFNAGTEAAALLPCPFCGGPAANIAFEYITCGAAWNESCAGHKIKCSPVEWNTRPSSSAPVERREAVAYTRPGFEKNLSFCGSTTIYSLLNKQEGDIPLYTDAILSLPGSSRDKVLEEAAKVADDKAAKWHEWNNTPQAFAAEHISLSIRALKSGVAK